MLMVAFPPAGTVIRVPAGIVSVVTWSDAAITAVQLSRPSGETPGAAVPA
jgi:hypothetical protein